jgi:hypothetical protein
MEIGMINIVYEVNSDKLIVDNVVDYIVKVRDRYIGIDKENFDIDVDEYPKQNKMRVHEKFVVVDMNVEKMMED